MAWKHTHSDAIARWARCGGSHSYTEQRAEHRSSHTVIPFGIWCIVYRTIAKLNGLCVGIRHRVCESFHVHMENCFPHIRSLFFYYFQFVFFSFLEWYVVFGLFNAYCLAARPFIVSFVVILHLKRIYSFICVWTFSVKTVQCLQSLNQIVLTSSERFKTFEMALIATHIQLYLSLQFHYYSTL